VKIKLEWYKASGKWYETYEVEVPDEIFLWSEDLAKHLQLDKHCHGEMYLVMDNATELSPTESMAGKFFKALWSPERVNLERSKL
jgi:hypothetical protein